MMHRGLSALVLALVCTAGGAQSLPERVDLSSLINLARDRSPRIALERQAIVAAQADRQVAGARPNPVLSYGRQARGNPFSGSGGQQDVSVELPLQIGGRREARIEAADRGIALAQARVLAASSQLIEEAGSVFLALLTAQERMAALDRALGEIERLAQIVAQRRESGVASQYDVIRMELELSAWRNRQTEAGAERTDLQSRLASLVGQSDWRPLAVGEFNPWPIDLEYKPDLSRHPSLRALQDDRALAQANLELAQRERLPSMSVTLGRSWGSDPQGATGSAGVSIEIPFLDTRIGLTHRAASELRSSILRSELTLAELSSELERQTALVRQRTGAFERSVQQVLPRLAAVRQMAEDAYRLGRGSLVDLLDATRVRNEAGLDQVAQIGALLEAQWRLKVVRGDPETRIR